MKYFLQFGHLIVLALIILLGIIAFNTLGYKDKLFDKPSYTEIIKSDIDKDNDGVDDYQDILDGAKKFIANKPKYKSKYYDSGYPNDEYMVCSDIIWYSLKNAGYDFKELIDEDIKQNKDKYDSDVGDTNIDFRRVRNILVYLENNALKLNNDGDFNPGDIVVYKNHIAIVSDKVNKDGVNYILHQHPSEPYEYNGLYKNKIIGHYRWVIK